MLCGILPSPCLHQGLHAITRDITSTQHPALHHPSITPPHTHPRIEANASLTIPPIPPCPRRVYVHCTAGLGRAPAVVIAYLYWFRGLPLHQAYDFLTSIRPCGPKKEAIRGATFDLMSGQPMDNFTRAPGDAFTNMPDVDRYALQWRVIRS